MGPRGSRCGACRGPGTSPPARWSTARSRSSSTPGASSCPSSCDSGGPSMVERTFVSYRQGGTPTTAPLSRWDDRRRARRHDRLRHDPARLELLRRPGLRLPCRRESVPEHFRRAAVLLLVGCHDGEPCIVLSERSARMRAHSGEIALPGGRIEPGETPEEAAVREATEEVGVDASAVVLLGATRRGVEQGEEPRRPRRRLVRRPISARSARPAPRSSAVFLTPLDAHRPTRGAPGRRRRDRRAHLRERRPRRGRLRHLRPHRRHRHGPPRLARGHRARPDPRPARRARTLTRPRLTPKSLDRRGRGPKTRRHDRRTARGRAPGIRRGRGDAISPSGPTTEPTSRCSTSCCSACRAGARVLDAGCGAGVPVTAKLARRGARDRRARLLDPAARARRGAGSRDRARAGRSRAPAVPDRELRRPRLVLRDHPRPARRPRAGLRRGAARAAARAAGRCSASARATSPRTTTRRAGSGAPMYWSHFDAATNLRAAPCRGLEIVVDRIVPDPMGHRGHLFALVRRAQD